MRIYFELFKTFVNRKENQFTVSREKANLSYE